VGTEFKVMQELLWHSSFRSTLVDAGRLHEGSNAREACSAGGGDIAGIFFRQGWSATRRWIGNCGSPKMGAKRALFAPSMVLMKSV